MQLTGTKHLPTRAFKHMLWLLLLLCAIYAVGFRNLTVLGIVFVGYSLVIYFGHKATEAPAQHVSLPKILQASIDGRDLILHRFDFGPALSEEIALQLQGYATLYCTADRGIIVARAERGLWAGAIFAFCKDESAIEMPRKRVSLSLKGFLNRVTPAPRNYRPPKDMLRQRKERTDAAPQSKPGAETVEYDTHQRPVGLKAWVAHTLGCGGVAWLGASVIYLITKDENKLWLAFAVLFPAVMYLQYRIPGFLERPILPFRAIIEHQGVTYYITRFDRTAGMPPLEKKVKNYVFAYISDDRTLVLAIKAGNNEPTKDVDLLKLQGGKYIVVQERFFKDAAVMAKCLSKRRVELEN